jgi:hypothetical protein
MLPRVKTDSLPVAFFIVGIALAIGSEVLPWISNLFWLGIVLIIIAVGMWAFETRGRGYRNG